MPNIFEETLNIPLPKCCSKGDCCKGASPSAPYHKLLRRAAAGDDFAKGFFSIMIPYASHEEARQVVPGVVERTLKAAKKLPEFQNPEEDIVFYHCRYLLPNNRCGVHEDRPQFCRDYPDTPFVVMAPGCAFEPWAAACREKYDEMKAEVAQLTELKAQLSDLQEIALSPDRAARIQQELLTHDLLRQEDRHHTGLSTVLSLSNLYLGSPLCSFFLNNPGK